MRVLCALLLCAVILAMLGLRPAGDPEEPSPLIGKPAPDVLGGEWINSSPISLAGLRGKVVLLEFWTYGCTNCRNTLPYLKSWNEKYKSRAFLLLGVHTPEFDSEKPPARVAEAARSLGLTYPIVTDNSFKVWESYHQAYWPALYLIDKSGIVRYCHVGEGGYRETERQIELLLDRPS